MSAYIKLSTLEYPRHEGDIRLEYPNIKDEQTGETFPCPDTYAVVTEVPQPQADWSAKEVAVELPPKQINGEWVMQWGIKVLSDEEYQNIITAQEEMNKLLGPPELPNISAPGTTPDVIG